VKESEALRTQARSDLDVADGRLGGTRCPAELRAHVVAKYQQCVEKSVKAAIVALRDAGTVLSLAANKPPTASKAPKTHEVARLVAGILHAPKGTKLDPVTQMQTLFGKKGVEDAVKAIDAHAPAWPKTAGALHARSTEYPFETTADQWKPPCDPDSFSAAEVTKAHAVAWQLFHALDKIVSALERVSP
jgi:hypothetical protein